MAFLSNAMARLAPQIFQRGAGGMAPVGGGGLLGRLQQGAGATTAMPANDAGPGGALPLQGAPGIPGMAGALGAAAGGPSGTLPYIPGPGAPPGGGIGPGAGSGGILGRMQGLMGGAGAPPPGGLGGPAPGNAPQPLSPPAIPGGDLQSLFAALGKQSPQGPQGPQGQPGMPMLGGAGGFGGLKGVANMGHFLGGGQPSPAGNPLAALRNVPQPMPQGPQPTLGRI